LDWSIKRLHVIVSLFFLLTQSHLEPAAMGTTYEKQVQKSEEDMEKEIKK
jgi:hypothetical protein